MLPEETKQEVTEKLEKETQAEIEVPKMDEVDDSVEDTPKGKVKSIIRKFEVRVQDHLSRQLKNINSQLESIHSSLHSQLDKKYGGMYKILISTFLTNIETKIYNNEITIEAMKRLLKEELHSIYAELSEAKGNKPISEEDYGKSFDETLKELREVVHTEVEEAKKKAEEGEKPDEKEKEQPTPETSEEVSETGKDQANEEA